MWVRDVNFPKCVIDAHRDDALVFFVGAGASFNAPSSLPDFKTLAERIAKDSLAPVEESDLAHPEILLGRIDDGNVDVHARVASLLGDGPSQPNRLHRAIIDLCGQAPRVRVVTTNYDRHLTTVLLNEHVAVPEFAGPALPMGDDFEGLVYLHGTLTQAPRHLVVTDKDFGRAYLRDAWAARFLERMFSKYVVLFIGYSYGDVVMRYLARALGPASGRYILTSIPDASDWRSLGITPIGYGGADSHQALVDAVEGWAELASMGLLEHRQRIARLVAAPPSQIPEEESYLEGLLANEITVRLFTELARGKEWLSWASSKPEFQQLFDPMAAWTESTDALAHWFAAHFVADPELTSEALAVLQLAGGRLSRAGWSAIGQRFHIIGSPRPPELQPWLTVLISTASDNDLVWIDYALTKSTWPEDRQIALRMLDFLTEPRLQLRPSFGSDARPRFELRMRGDGRLLREAWQRVFTPNLTDCAVSVLAIVDGHLRSAHRQLIVAGEATPAWDSTSFRRSAIEEHPQDAHRGDIDALIDAARDCIEHLLGDGDDTAITNLTLWANSDVPLLRRIAVHGWKFRSDVQPTAKIRWILDRNLLFDSQLRHEVFELIETALPDCDANTTTCLVNEAVIGPSNIENPRSRAYEIFNALAWIAKNAPASKSARRALKQCQANHPDFAVRDFPDLLSIMSFGFVEPSPPMTLKELHTAIGNDASEAVATLLTFESVQAPFHGPTWDDAKAVLAESVRNHPADGFAVLAAVNGHNHGIVRSVVRGWSCAHLSPDEAASVIECLGTLDIGTITDDLSRLFGDGGQNESAPTNWHSIDGARKLATKLWTSLPSIVPEHDPDDWLSQAINRPAGRLALFWLHAIAEEWKAASENWSGIPSDILIALDRILAGSDHNSKLAEVVIASQLHFFFNADQNWTTTHVTPLLDWSNVERATRTWQGYLVWGRWNNRLLSAGLLDQYLIAAMHIASFGEEEQRQLASHLATIAIFGEIDPSTWLPRFTSNASVATRCEWIDNVSWRLAELDDVTVEHQWNRWMRNYWQDRSDSIPTDLHPDEATALVGWISNLTDSFEVAARFAMTRPARIRNHFNMDELLPTVVVDRFPQTVAELLAHLLTSTKPPFYLGSALREVVGKLKAHAVTYDALEVVKGHALGLGCADAVDW